MIRVTGYHHIISSNSNHKVFPFGNQMMDENGMVYLGSHESEFSEHFVHFIVPSSSGLRKPIETLQEFEDHAFLAWFEVANWWGHKCWSVSFKFRIKVGTLDIDMLN